MNSPSLPPEVVDALQEGRALDAIKLLRESRRIGLAEARQAVEEYRQRHAPRPGVAVQPVRASVTGFLADALRQGSAREAVKALREKTGLGFEQAHDAVEAGDRPKPLPTRSDLAPGEVPRRDGLARAFVILLLTALAAYAYFGKAAE